MHAQPVELVAQRADAAVHVLEPLAESTELLLEARARAVDIAGNVGDVVEQAMIQGNGRCGCFFERWRRDAGRRRHRLARLAHRTGERIEAAAQHRRAFGGLFLGQRLRRGAGATLLETLDEPFGVHQIRFQASRDMAARRHAGGILGHRRGRLHAGGRQQIGTDEVQPLGHLAPSAGGRIARARRRAQQLELREHSPAQPVGAEQGQPVGHLQHALGEPAALGEPRLVRGQRFHDLARDGQRLVQQREHRGRLIRMPRVRRSERREQRAARGEHAERGVHVTALADIEEQITHQGRSRLRSLALPIAETLELAVELAEQALHGDAHAPARILEQRCERAGGTPQVFLGAASGERVQACEHLGDAT